MTVATTVLVWRRLSLQTNGQEKKIRKKIGDKKKKKRKEIPKESLVEQMKRLAWFGANALEDLFISFKWKKEHTHPHAHKNIP